MPLITIEISDIDECLLRELSDVYGFEVPDTAKHILGMGIGLACGASGFTSSTSDASSPLSPHTPLSPSKSLSVNNKKITTSLSIPLVAEKKVSRKKPLLPMPKIWVDSRDSGTVPMGFGIIEYAEKNGYDFYLAKEMFLEFVDHHLAKGNKFADWTRAWYKWVRNDTKFHGAPSSGKQVNSVLKSYRNNRNPIEELLNGAI